jgi:tyrosine-protein phosphatase SIW14
LVPETYPEDNVKFLQENGIKHYQIGMPGNKENSITPVSDEKITAALSIILNRSNHPLLIHCNKGKVGPQFHSKKVYPLEYQTYFSL